MNYDTPPSIQELCDTSAQVSVDFELPASGDITVMVALGPECEEFECKFDRTCSHYYGMEYCSNNQCSDEPECDVNCECSRDMDCDVGKHCNNGMCVDSDCILDCNCGEGYACTDGMCSTCEATCASDEDCPEEVYCFGYGFRDRCTMCLP